MNEVIDPRLPSPIVPWRGSSMQRSGDAGRLRCWRLLRRRTWRWFRCPHGHRGWSGRRLSVVYPCSCRLPLPQRDKSDDRRQEQSCAEDQQFPTVGSLSVTILLFLLRRFFVRHRAHHFHSRCLLRIARAIPSLRSRDSRYVLKGRSQCIKPVRRAQKVRQIVGQSDVLDPKPHNGQMAIGGELYFAQHLL